MINFVSNFLKQSLNLYYNTRCVSVCFHVETSTWSALQGVQSREATGTNQGQCSDVSTLIALSRPHGGTTAGSLEWSWVSRCPELKVVLE